jgi:hypothetical protein
LYGQLERIEVAVLDVVGASGQGKDAVDVWGAAQDDQPTADPPRVDAGADDRVHARGVHERELAQVEHNQLRL